MEYFSIEDLRSGVHEYAKQAGVEELPLKYVLHRNVLST